ncbi:MAG: DUF4249 family protein [Bacteroidota bacterium]
MKEHKSPKSITLTPLFLVLFFVGIGTSCLDPIDLDLPSGASDAVVLQGKLTYGNPSIFQLNIRRIFAFNAENTSGVNASRVTLKNNQGQNLNIDRIGDGVYIVALDPNDPDFEINFENTYSIEVQLFNGEIYASSPERLIAVPQMDSISFAKTTIQTPDPDNEGETNPVDFVEFSINTPLTVPGTNERSRLRWDMERTYKITERPAFGQIRKTCYITNAQGIFQPVSFDATDQDLDYLSSLALVNDVATFPFIEGYYSTVYQESLSEGAFTYFSQIESSITREGDMFEAPAGRIFTNLFNINDESDPIYGYFYVTQRDTIRQYVSPDFLMNYDTLCLRMFDMDVPDVCVDCLTEGGSEAVAPSWWVE